MTKLLDRLRHLRIDNGKQKEELATYLSISIDSYNRYERGSRQPDIDSLVKLAIFYGVTLDYLLGRDELEIPVFERNNVVSYRDLIDFGINGKLAHGLIKQIVSKQRFEDRLMLTGSNVSYVSKADVKKLLSDLLKLFEE